jgi:cell division protein FtsZ
MIGITPTLSEAPRTRVAVIGIGGAGGNIVANMAGDIPGVEFIVANTDAQALNVAGPQRRIQLGIETTSGLGAGSRPDIGKAAAEESRAEIEAALEGVDMCFIAAGMGGGTGTGAAPVVARLARGLNILTIGVVTRPFDFEGGRRGRTADAGIECLGKEVDTLVVVPNQNLFRIVDHRTTIRNAFHFADEILSDGVRDLAELMATPGLVNLDLADVRFIIAGGGRGMMGTGRASGENRARRAVDQALSHPLLDGGLEGACGVIVSIAGGDLLLAEVGAAAEHIQAILDPEAYIAWGSAIDPNMKPGEIRVSIVATGSGAPASVPLAVGPASSDKAEDCESEPQAPVAPIAVCPPMVSSDIIVPVQSFENRREATEDHPEAAFGTLSPGARLFQRMATMANAAGNAPTRSPSSWKLSDNPAVYDRRLARGPFDRVAQTVECRSES